MVTTLADLHVNDSFAMTATVNLIDGSGIHLTLKTTSPASTGAILLASNGTITGTATAPTQHVLEPGAIPTTTQTNDHPAYCLGMVFQADVAGSVSGITWYVPTGWDGSAGNVTAALYSTGGSPTQLGISTSQTVIGGTWADFTLGSAVSVAAATDYMAVVQVGVRTGGADYGNIVGLFVVPTISGHLTASGGAFVASGSMAFPTTNNTIWYGLDVDFQAIASGIYVTIVGQVFTVNDVVQNDSTGEVMVVRASWSDTTGPRWSNTVSGETSYSTTGWTRIGAATIS